MKSNVGGIDKIARILVGAGLVGATVAGMLPVWGYIGAVPLVTGLMGWCPLYRVFGLNTCPMAGK
jgi:hypothetical protein